MPCDTFSNLYLQQYNKVLSLISTNIHYNNVHHCINPGDLNTDFTRSDSGNTTSLTSFIKNENPYSVLQYYNSRMRLFNTTLKMVLNECTTYFLMFPKHSTKLLPMCYSMNCEIE